MKKVFLSHASEDKLFVEHIYTKLKEKYNDTELWLDKFEIYGGSSLIDKIAEGIESSDKFIIFLSDISIQKPWVNKELKKAIIKEIDEEKDYIIPVVINDILKTPAFLEDKFYIKASEYTEPELIEAIYHSINDRNPLKGNSGKLLENLQIGFKELSNNKLGLQLGAKFWAEEISFRIEFDEKLDIILNGGVSEENKVVKFFAKSPNEFSATFSEDVNDTVYFLHVRDRKITPGNPLCIILTFHKIPKNIISISKWNDGLNKPIQFVREFWGFRKK